MKVCSFCGADVIDEATSVCVICGQSCFVSKEETETFSCTCIECGHKVKSKKHCKDIPCPECGGKMRRAERPGPGQKSIEYKRWAIPFELKEVNEDDNYFFFTGYASTFGNADLGDDVVIQGAFVASLKQRMPKLCYQHDTHKVIGVITACAEDGKGLFVAGKMPKTHSLAKDVAALISCGGIDSMSIGYSIVEADLDNNAGIRYLTKLDLYEVSFVTFPMNERARINDFKMVVPYQNLVLADKSTGWDVRGAMKRLNEWAKVKDKPNPMYRKAFLWCDDEDKDNFGAYRFPIADIIDGEIKAIPRAIYAAAGALHSGRGTNGISDDDMRAIKANVSKYYKRLDITAPWDSTDKNVREIIDGIKTIKDANEYLREKGLTDEERTGLISKIKLIADDRKEMVDAVNSISRSVNQLEDLKKVVQNL